MSKTRARSYVGETIRLVDLIPQNEWTLRDVGFEDCDVLGPAIVYVENDVEIGHCEWDAPDESALYWPIGPDRQAITGAVVLEACSFSGCRMAGIGVAYSPDQESRIRAGFGS